MVINKKNKKSVSNGVKFMIGVIVLYFIIAMFNFNLILESLNNTLLVFRNIIPILLVVYIVMMFITRYVHSERLQKYVGPDSGTKGWIYAAIFGILISGPPYILYPLLGDLKKAGMKDSLIAVFLYNRNVKIPFIPVMIYYFGLGFTVIISVYIIIFSIINGMLVEKITKNGSK